MSYVTDAFAKAIQQKDIATILQLKKSYPSQFTTEMNAQLQNPTLFASTPAATTNLASALSGGSTSAATQAPTSWANVSGQSTAAQQAASGSVSTSPAATAEATPWWIDALKQAAATNNTSQISAIKGMIGDTNFGNADVQAILPAAYKQDASTQATSAKASADAAAARVGKPSFIVNANAARAVGLDWTQEQQDAQELGAPVGFENQAAQTQYAANQKASVAPKGVNQSVRDLLVQGFKNSDPVSALQGVVTSQFGASSSAKDPTKLATLQNAIDYAQTQGVDPKTIQTSLYGVLARKGAYALMANPALKIGGEALFPGISGNSDLFMPGSTDLSPSGMNTIASNLSKFNVPSDATSYISNLLQKDAEANLALKGGSWQQAGYTATNTKIDALKQSIALTANPNDPNYKTGDAANDITAAQNAIRGVDANGRPLWASNSNQPAANNSTQTQGQSGSTSYLWGNTTSQGTTGQDSAIAGNGYLVSRGAPSSSGAGSTNSSQGSGSSALSGALAQKSNSDPMASLGANQNSLISAMGQSPELIQALAGMGLTPESVASALGQESQLSYNLNNSSLVNPSTSASTGNTQPVPTGSQWSQAGNGQSANMAASASPASASPAAANKTSKDAYPTLWDKNGNWIGSSQTNDRPYNAITNPFGAQSTKDPNATSTSNRNYVYKSGQVINDSLPPLAIYNAQSGTWESITSDASGNYAPLDGMSSLISQLQQSSGQGAQIMPGTPSYNNNLTNAAANANQVGGGTYAASSGMYDNNPPTDGPTQVESGLGSGGPTPGITYSDNGNTTPAPFTLANALTNDMAAQSLSDTYAAQRNFGLNNPDTQGPLGSTTYENVGTQTNPQYKQTNSIGSAQQKALDNTLNGQAGVSSLYGSLPSALYQGLNNSVKASNEAANSPQVGTYDVMSQDNINQTASRQANPNLPNNLVDPTSILNAVGNAPKSDTKSLWDQASYGVDTSSLTRAAGKSPTSDISNLQNVDNSALRTNSAPVNSLDPTTALNYAKGTPQSDVSSLRNVNTDALRTNINDFSGAMSQAQNAAYNNFSNLMEPGYQQEQAQNRSRLINQGLQEGTQGYQTAMDNLSRQQNYARTTAANNAVLTGNQTGLAQQQQLAANQGQLYGQTANTQNQEFTQNLNSNNQDYTQKSNAFQQALTGQNTQNQMALQYLQNNSANQGQLYNQTANTQNQGFTQALNSNNQNFSQLSNALQQALTGQNQTFNQVATAQNQGFTQQMASNNQDYNQRSTALQQALAGQLGAAGQQYSQTQGNFNDLYKALAQQGVTAQNNAQQGSINMNSRVNAANAGAAPINSLSNAIAQLGTPTLPTQTPVNATGGSNTSLAQAMQSQKQTSLGNQNAAQMYNVIQDNQQPTRYGIDVNGNIFAL